MKRHIQNAGAKKWFGDYLCELESEPLKAVDKWASAYGGCVLSGGLLTLVSGTTYNISAGLIILKYDGEYMTVPLAAANNVDVSVQKAIRITRAAVTGQYQNPVDLTIAYNYSAEIIDYTAGLGTLNEDYLLISTSGAAIRSYADVIKDALAVATTAAKGLMSASDKTKLDGIATNANNYVHPSTHNASMINEDSTHRFATDTEKSAWNAKIGPSDVVTSPTASKILKLDASAQFPASVIAETTTKRFITDAERNNFWSGDGSTKVYISSKNVGIRNTAPSEALDVTGRMKSSLGRVVSGTYQATDVTHNTLFDALKNHIPNTGDHIIISGSLYTNSILYLLSSMERTDSTHIRFYIMNTSGTVSSVVISDGAGSSANISIAW